MSIITQFISEQRRGLIHFIRAAVRPEGANGFVNWVLILSLIFLWPAEAKNRKKAQKRLPSLWGLTSGGCIYMKNVPCTSLMKSWGHLRSWRLSVTASRGQMLTLNGLTFRGCKQKKKSSSCYSHEKLLRWRGCPRPWRLPRAVSTLRSGPISARPQIMRSDII